MKQSFMLINSTGVQVGVDMEANIALAVSRHEQETTEARQHALDETRTAKATQRRRTFFRFANIQE